MKPLSPKERRSAWGLGLIAAIIITASSAITHCGQKDVDVYAKEIMTTHFENQSEDTVIAPKKLKDHKSLKSKGKASKKNKARIEKAIKKSGTQEGSLLHATSPLNRPIDRKKHTKETEQSAEITCIEE